MSKAILLIDMPENCFHCKLQDWANCRIVKGCHVGVTRPDWCPLKPMLRKKTDGETLKIATENDCYYDTTEDKAYFNGYDKGYNACIDDILKGD